MKQMRIVRVAKDAYHRILNMDEKINQTAELLGISKKISSISYAQWGEDVLIEKMFKIIPNNRTFIDVGAHDPYEISNTAIMHQRGWKGINVEPNPVLYKRFLEQRPDDINLCCGVASVSGQQLPFYMVDDHSPVNSFQKELVEHHIKMNPELSIRKVIQVETVRLSEIIEKYSGGYSRTICQWI